MPFAAPGQTILTVGGRRQVVGSPASSAKTYAEWLAFERARLTPTVRAWDASATITVTTAAWETQTTSARIGDMIGSSWVNTFRSNAEAGVAASPTASRIIQHGLTSQAVLNSLDGTVVFWQTSSEPGPASTFPSVNRNGYTSISSGTVTTARKLDWIRYFDPVLGPMQVDSFAGTGPTPYSW